MKLIKATCLSLLFMMTPHHAHAGRWVDWDTVATDISSGFNKLVNFVNEKRYSLMNDDSRLHITGTNIVAKNNVAIAGIQSIKINGSGSLILAQHKTQAEQCVIEADEAIMPYIDVETKNGELRISIKPNIQVQTKVPTTYQVRIKDINDIKVCGSIDIELKNIEAPVLSLCTSGCSTVKGHVTTKDVQVRAAGSSKIELSGNADVQQITLSGSSTFDGRNLYGQKMVLTGEGAITVHSNISNSIVGQLSGAGSLLHSGNPELKVTTRGAATIKKLS